MNKSRKKSISIKEIVEKMRNSEPLTQTMIKKILLNGKAGPIIELRTYVPNVQLLCTICLDKHINTKTKHILIEEEMFDDILNIINPEDLESINIEETEIKKIMERILRTSRMNNPPPPEKLNKQNSVSNSLLTELDNPDNIRRMTNIMGELRETNPFENYVMTTHGISKTNTLHYTWSIEGTEVFHLSLKPKPNSKSTGTRVSNYSKNMIGSLHVKFVNNPTQTQYKRISITIEKGKYVIRLIKNPKLSKEQNDIMDGICAAIVKYYAPNAIYKK